jgi:hypothetical protein
MNFSTRFLIVVSFCGEKSPEAETNKAVIVSRASSRGDKAVASSSEKYDLEA